MFHILRSDWTVVGKWVTTSCRPFWRVYWNATPGALIKTQNQEVNCVRSSLICIPPGLNVEQILVEPFEHLWFHVDTPLLSNYSLEIHELEIGREMVGRFERLVDLFQKGQENSSAAHDLKQLVIYWFMTGIQISKGAENQEVSELVGKAIQIMDKRIQSGVTSRELAEMLGVSSKTLVRQFNKYLHVPPHKFLTTLRLKKAAALLFSKSLSIDEISDLCGFCNRSHFTRTFSESYNQTPSAFRKELSG